MKEVNHHTFTIDTQSDEVAQAISTMLNSFTSKQKIELTLKYSINKQFIPEDDELVTKPKELLKG